LRKHCKILGEKLAEKEQDNLDKKMEFKLEKQKHKKELKACKKELEITSNELTDAQQFIETLFDCCTRPMSENLAERIIDCLEDLDYNEYKIHFQKLVYHRKQKKMAEKQAEAMIRRWGNGRQGLLNNLELSGYDIIKIDKLVEQSKGKMSNISDVLTHALLNNNLDSLLLDNRYTT